MRRSASALVIGGNSRIRYLPGIHLPADKGHNAAGREPPVGAYDVPRGVEEAPVLGEIRGQSESIAGESDP